MNQFDAAVNSEAEGKYSEYYKAFYYLNRGVLRAEMIDFISSIENNVQTLTMDDQGTTRARVSPRTTPRHGNGGKKPQPRAMPGRNSTWG